MKIEFADNYAFADNCLHKTIALFPMPQQNQVNQECLVVSIMGSLLPPVANSDVRWQNICTILDLKRWVNCLKAGRF